MVSLSELRDLEIRELAEAARGWGDISNRAYAARDKVKDDIAKNLDATQEGLASMAAIARLGRLIRNYQYIHVECGLIQASLNGLAQELAAPQKRLVQALADAASRGFKVHDDGSVSYPAAGEATNGRQPVGDTATGSSGLLGRGLSSAVSGLNPNPNAAPAQNIANEIATALSHAAEVDTQYSTALRRLKAEPGLDVTSATWGDVSGDSAAVHRAADDALKSAIPTGESPTERRQWWEGLSSADRATYMALYPETIGNLDGIPATARDEANRTYLPQLMGKLELQGDEDSRTKLDGLRVIQDKLNSTSQPPMFLLGIGDEGNGRAIVAYGNPDTSKNVSAYIPGLGTNLDEDFANNDLKRARDTAALAQEVNPSSASIVWLGYDAPQSADVMSAGDAERGAPAYNSFMAGLSATNENSDPHVTAIGHSYGSRTLGAATQQPGGIPGADDIILVGSPATGADHAEELGVGKEHVWVGAAKNDVVTKLPAPDELAFGLPGVLAAYNGLGDDLWFGRDPASEEFGANRFRTDDGPSLFVDAWLDGKLIDPEAHSNYFDPDKDQLSAENIAAIVAGEPGKVIPEARR
ncbi:alpha/beta hydrolase [Streptomyces sp. B-S-A8]|uniref:Alpha/beta hydrolase n=1 Tax=Streptomyces solicavernae TaxID=3043614 RepID=A0ABT6S173_9ACTN|nr:alpha/beta hydrolase [Streptomyces sp. B-S-A8]MDI3390412.1 alpha/beta hydrolase [Streptomyces sp. B-S-A8]